MFLAHTVTRAKWQSKSGDSGSEIPTDAVTGDLRTRNRTLPLWRCSPGIHRGIEVEITV